MLTVYKNYVLRAHNDKLIYWQRIIVAMAYVL